MLEIAFIHVGCHRPQLMKPMLWAPCHVVNNYQHTLPVTTASLTSHTFQSVDENLTRKFVFLVLYWQATPQCKSVGSVRPATCGSKFGLVHHMSQGVPKISRIVTSFKSSHRKTKIVFIFLINSL